MSETITELSELWARALDEMDGGAMTPQQRAFVNLTRPLGLGKRPDITGAMMTTPTTMTVTTTNTAATVITCLATPRSPSTAR